MTEETEWVVLYIVIGVAGLLCHIIEYEKPTQALAAGMFWPVYYGWALLRIIGLTKREVDALGGVI